MKKNNNRRRFLKTSVTGVLGAGIMGLNVGVLHSEEKKEKQYKILFQNK